MHENIKTVPVLAKPGKYGVDLVIRGDVTRVEQIGVLAEALGQLLNAAAQLVVLVSECIATPTISAFLPAIKPIGFPQCESERRLF
jgi:hypothetical protein